MNDLVRVFFRFDSWIFDPLNFGIPAKAISQRLLATRLQLLDLFFETEPQIRPGQQ